MNSLKSVFFMLLSMAGFSSGVSAANVEFYLQNNRPDKVQFVVYGTGIAFDVAGHSTRQVTVAMDVDQIPYVAVSTANFSSSYSDFEFPSSDLRAALVILRADGIVLGWPIQSTTETFLPLLLALSAGFLFGWFFLSPLEV